MKSSYAAIIVLLACSVLSVDAIFCHQCNSHLDEDCVRLRLNTPRAPRDNQYLRECVGPTSGVAFCRKTVVTIEVTREHRIVRSCGWNNEEQDGCFTADNEGYLQTICTCYEDGCNAASRIFAWKNALQMLAVMWCGLLVTMQLRQSG